MLSVIKPSVWFIILIIGFPQLSETIFAPLLPFIVDKFETTQTLSQMSLSVFFTGFAFGVLFWGSLSDRIGRKKALLLGVLCYTVGSFLLYTAPTIEIFLGYRVLQAFGAASGSIISQTILRECFTQEKERIATFSTVSAALSWTPALGPLLGGQIVASFGMGLVFIFLALLGAGVFLCSQRILKEVYKEGTEKVKFWKVAKRMALDPQIYLNIALVGGFNAIIFSIYSETPFVFMNTFGWSARSYSFIGIIMAVCSVTGARLNKKLAYKGWSTIKRLRFGLLWMIFVSLLYMAPTLLGFDHSSFKVAWMLISLGLVFIGVVIALPGVLGESLNAYRDCLGTAGALFGLCYYLVLSLLLGVISSFSSESLLFIGLMITYLSLVMLLLTRFVKYKSS